MSTTPLRVGIFDREFRPYFPGLTAYQTYPLPKTLVYIDNCDNPDLVDVAIATYGSAEELLSYIPAHPRRALWLQESRALYPHPPLSFVKRFDLVLTNDAALLTALGPKGRWLTPLGTWISDFATPTTKTASCSFLAKTHNRAEGHTLRHIVANAGLLGVDMFGGIMGQERLPTKDPVLRPYRFHIAIENSRYDWYATEKLFDPMATRTVPIYWGCPDLSKLETLGFDPAGILAFDTLDDLTRLLAEINRHGERLYESLRGAIETNYAAISRNRQTEVLLESILREAFDLR